MHRLVKLCLLAAAVARCGAPEDEPTPQLEANGPVVPMLSINGDTVPDAGFVNDWRPTGVAFDSRPEGWRISCLKGLQLRFGPGDAPGSLRLFCVQLEPGAP